MAEDWDRWIEHDGQKCPVPAGVLVNIFAQSGREFVVISYSANDDHGVPNSWIWEWRKGQRVCRDAFLDPVVRYRLVKPRGLRLLEGLLEDIPEVETA